MAASLRRIPLLELRVSHPTLFFWIFRGHTHRHHQRHYQHISLPYCFLLDRSCSLCVWGDYFQKRIKVTLCFPSLYLQSSSNWQSWYFIPLPLPVGTKTNHNFFLLTILQLCSSQFDENVFLSIVYLVHRLPCTLNKQT